MNPFFRENASSLTVSVVGHAALFLIMGLNFALRPTPAPAPVQLAIEATVIDVSEIRRQREAVQRQEQAVENERRRKQEASRRKQETERLKRDKARLAEQREKADTERRRAEEVARKAQEARVAEEKRQSEAAERRRVEAEEKRRQAESQANLQRELDAEERRLVAIESGQLAQYIALIKDRVGRNWVRPASARSGVECDVYVSQIPGGEVVNVRVGQCNGDTAVVRSIEAAVFNSSPLPPPSDPSLFDRNLRFTFKPEE